MIQFSSLQDGVLVYAKNTTDDPELGRIVELRVENNFESKYFAKYEGMYLPMYTLSYGDVDRLLIKLPPIEPKSIYPIYLVKRERNILYSEADFVFFFDNLSNPQYITPRQGAVYSITRRGFIFTSGKLKVAHEETPVKFKMHIPNITSHGKFHMYNPDTGYLDWTVEIDGLDIYVNDVFETTLTNEAEIEMDLGFNSERLVTNFYELGDTLYTSEHSEALETMPAISDSILEIEGLDALTIDWMMCYKASFQNTEVYGTVEYTDIMDLATTGQPLLTDITKFGNSLIKSNSYEKELGVQRILTTTDLSLYGMSIKLREHLLNRSILETEVYNVITNKHPLEIIVFNTDNFKSLLCIPVGSVITKDIEIAPKLSKADFTADLNSGIKLSKQNHFSSMLGIQRQIALQEDYYYGQQPTFLKEVVVESKYSMTTRKESELTSEKTLMIILKKILGNVEITSETFKDIYFLSTLAGNGGVESK